VKRFKKPFKNEFGKLDLEKEKKLFSLPTSFLHFGPLADSPLSKARSPSSFYS
jgi:hypothetical protein